MQYAQAELSAICRAVGVMKPQDTAELHHKPLVITVVRKAREDTGAMDNEISAYAKHCDQPLPPSSPAV